MKISTGMRCVLLAGALMLSMACGTTKISTGSDPKVDFSLYHSYAFAGSEDTGVFQAAFSVAAGNELEKKGFKADTENPDLLVYVWGAVDNDLHWASMNVGYAPAIGWSSFYGYGFMGGYEGVLIGIRQVAIGTVFIDLVDAGTKTLVFRGIAEKTINSDVINAKKIKARMESICRTIFADFPPGK